MTKSIIGIIVLLVVVGGWFFWTQQSNKQPNISGFENISSNELSTMLTNKDFTLLDVHIPEQKHIPGTDYMISYQNIDKIKSVIPNKTSKVVLYCRSGNMSKLVAQELVKSGYTNVFNLDGGLRSWISEGNKTVPKGSIPSI